MAQCWHFRDVNQLFIGCDAWCSWTLPTTVHKWLWPLMSSKGVWKFTTATPLGPANPSRPVICWGALKKYRQPLLDMGLRVNDYEVQKYSQSTVSDTEDRKYMIVACYIHCVADWNSHNSSTRNNKIFRQRLTYFIWNVLTLHNTLPSKWHSKGGGEVLGFDTRQGFGERVGHHLISWTIDESDMTLFNDVSNKMIMDVNMLGMCMVVVVMSQGHSRLIVAIECSGLLQWLEHFPH